MEYGGGRKKGRRAGRKGGGTLSEFRISNEAVIFRKVHALQSFNIKYGI